MGGGGETRGQGSVDWLGLCDRAAASACAVLAEHPSPQERAQRAGLGAGGDHTLVIDRAVEDAVVAELERAPVGINLISEERGELELNGGGTTHVVVDPIDGSRNAQRTLPGYALSILIASGPMMGNAELGFVHDLARDERWWARRGGGAFRGARRLAALHEGPLDLLGIEMVSPAKIAAHADALVASGAARLRTIGSVALSLCQVAAGRLDALASLDRTRSVDAAAGQLIVREAGGAVCFPDVSEDLGEVPLNLAMRSRLLAAATPSQLDRLRVVGSG